MPEQDWTVMKEQMERMVPMALMVHREMEIVAANLALAGTVVPVAGRMVEQGEMAPLHKEQMAVQDKPRPCSTRVLAVVVAVVPLAVLEIMMAALAALVPDRVAITLLVEEKEIIRDPQNVMI